MPMVLEELRSGVDVQAIKIHNLRENDILVLPASWPDEDVAFLRSVLPQDKFLGYIVADDLKILRLE